MADKLMTDKPQSKVYDSFGAMFRESGKPGNDELATFCVELNPVALNLGRELYVTAETPHRALLAVVKHLVEKVVKLGDKRLLELARTEAQKEVES